MKNANDMQPVQLNQTKSDVVTHQPPPYNDRTKVQTGQAFSQNQADPAFIVHNAQVVVASFVPNTGSVLIPIRGQPSVMDHINIIWSVVNTCCCLWPLGLIAFITSIVTVKKRHRDENESARRTGCMTTVLNVLATIGGIILFLVYFLPRIQNRIH